MKTGQAAMEFLMTYGWAIVIVMISIGALAYFGVTRPEKFLPEKCLVATGSGIFCSEYSASSAAETITLRLRNILGEQISVSGITLDSHSCSTSSPRSIEPGSTTDFTLACSESLEPGTRIKGNLAVSYQIGAAGLPKSASGQLLTVVP